MPRTEGIESGLLPTITATEGGYNKSSPNGKKRPTLTTMARKNLWPTPRSAMTGYVTPKRLNDKHENLETAVSREMLATPTTQDAKNNGSQSQQNRNTKPLNAQVGGPLNPEFVEWLMGYPVGWTDLKDSETP
jgi:hypothetical protein